METSTLFIATIDEETGKAFVKEIEIPSHIRVPEEYLIKNCIEYISFSRDKTIPLVTVNQVNFGIKWGETMKCKQCGKYFFLSGSNIDWYKEKGLNIPKRCMACRKKNTEKQITKWREGILTRYDND